ACQSHWCWTCGKLLDGRLSLGLHYNPANPAGCLQFSALESKASQTQPGTVLGFLVFWCTLPLWFLCGLGLIVTVVALVAVGEKRQLRIPPSEGYGQRGYKAWGIPPDAVMVFTLEASNLQILQGWQAFLQIQCVSE
ncbi:FKBP7, partial [Symbiodinium necroappetens]